MTLSAEAYCRSGLGKVSERTDTQTNAADFTTANPIAASEVESGADSGPAPARDEAWSRAAPG